MYNPTKAKQLNHNRFFRQLSAPVTVGTAPAAGTSTTVNPFDIPLQREEFFFEKETPKLRLTSKLYERRKKLQPIWKSKRNKNQSQREVTTSLPSIQINQPSSEESCTMSQIPVSPLSLQNPTSTTVLSPGAPCLSYIFSDDESVETNNPNNVIQQRKRRFSTSPGVYYDPNFLAPPIVNDPEIFIQNRTSTRRKYSSESLSRVDNESVFSFSSRGSVVSTNSSSFLSITKSPSPTRARRMEIITTFNSFIIVLVFIALWTPFPAATLYLDKSKMEWNFLSFCIGMVSSLTNPIMYGLSIKAFQKELKKLNEKRKRKNNVQRFKKANN
ncbi:uncharacterized protein [Lepeophtheirus salmonis]|uniref:uncharacterized protein isoform X1 n=1 Tax=Lepeophtheirus salmonis TaxID=72036 RepID=UPI001AE68D82|nr:uncharacterized protein LOC121128576 [Lepeophtheirus salmonis]